ncbi:hypothetical protein P8874_04440 [Bacillus licheniformis]|uniref:hypothetical protein n=1 Tax=Bacillus licheniformis TaxID=1402 RepID=UPI002DB9DCC5|nr:hypothetical protein [Bacillus licheniformis]MEC0715374.1 hypothetical protein [Bacillus licheniformis]
MGDFFYSTLSYDRDKKNEREYRVQEGEPADTELTALAVCLVSVFLFERKDDMKQEKKKPNKNARSVLSVFGGK